jgi:hypothetical protein
MDKATRQLEGKVGDILLDFARLYGQVTNSDLQGIATVQARKIIELLKANAEDE